MLNKTTAITLVCVLTGSAVALSPTHTRSTQTTGPCAPSNTVLVQDLTSLFQWMMGGDDSSRVAARTQAAIPKIDSTTIAFVSDTVVCRAAAIAYTTALRDTTTDRSVHVIKIGNRYVVLDPFKWPGQVTPEVTFDSAFTAEIARVMR